MRLSSLALRSLVLPMVLCLPVLAQMTPEQQATMLLDSARRAYNEKNYPFAATRFREYLQRYGSNPAAPQARFGLALCLLEGTERNYEQALEQLNQLVGNKSLPEYPQALYYSGIARRSQGLQLLEQALTKPGEAQQLRNTAQQRFSEAARHFGEAVVAFKEAAKTVKAPEKGLSIPQEWIARAACDQAEMLLRQKKAKEALAAVAFLSDKEWQSSRYLSLGQYYQGFASFLQGDYATAGKLLSHESVLSDEAFGTHARYLLARVHHLNTKTDEREEARVNYQKVLQDHEAARKTAQERLRQPEQFRDNPELRARLERLVKGPAPEHVARATFFLGELQYEDNRFAEALEHFKSFVTQYPNDPLTLEAQLRVGFCQAQLKQNEEAIKTLQPLIDRVPALSDQAIYWIGRAELNKVDPKRPETYNAPLATLRRAADRAGQLAGGNPPDLRARTRRGNILVDLAETLHAIGQHREAVNAFNTILNEKLLPDREDEILLHLTTAQQLAGDYAESDKTGARFLAAHKDSPLLPAVLFRMAENSALQAVAAEKLPNPADRSRETTKFNDQAIQRYTSLIEKYPESANVQFARQALGMAHYRKGDLEKAQKALEAIPPADRTGELATVNYNLADILIRQAPARADDAVSAGRVEEKLRSAAEALEAFLGNVPEGPQSADALLKLGYCQARMARLLAQPAEQQKLLAAARSTFERLQQKFPKSESAPQALFERAKVLALQNDLGGAMNELRRFSGDPLKSSKVAPLTQVYLATLLRRQKQAAEAARVMEQCRKDQEAALSGDPSRAGWLVLLRYEHAAALREAGKLDEARGLFDEIGRTFTDRPEGWDAVLRAGQTARESAENKLTAARKQLATQGLNREQRAKAEQQYNEAITELRNAVNYLTTQEQNLRNRKPVGEEQGRTLAQIRGRLLYESAWGWRTLADLEVQAARLKIQQERWQKRRDEVTAQTPPGQTPPAVPLPEVALREVPRQPAEDKARQAYQELIKTFPELAVNADARLELAELLSVRDEHNEAIQQLQAALEAEKEPSPELTDKIKVRLGACLLDRGSRKILEARRLLAANEVKPADKEKADKLSQEGTKDVEAALEQLQPVTGNEKSPMLAQASYREAECLLQLGRLDEAIKLLSKFRDFGPFQNIAGLSDRALLRLGQALSEKKQWDASRNAYETLLGRFGNSPWANEARYGIGWAFQNQANYDAAINFYNQVSAATASELGARAQINIGVCRLLQKRFPEASAALLVVPYTYDYPELSALALMEAARAFAENKQNDQAIRLLRRVIKDHAGSSQAEAARKRLADLGDG